MYAYHIYVDLFLNKSIHKDHELFPAHGHHYAPNLLRTQTKKHYEKLIHFIFYHIDNKCVNYCKHHYLQYDTQYRNQMRQQLY